MIRFAENLNKMITAGLGGALEAPSTEVAVGHRVRYMEASGPVASFETNIAAPIRSLRVDMQPIQDLNGQDAPYPAGGGKNLLQVTATSQTINGVTFTVNADGTVTANGTATATAFFELIASNISFTESTILNGCPSGGGGDTYAIQLNGTTPLEVGSGITIAENTTITSVRIRIASGVTLNNVVFKPMIRLASVTDATFAPYSNICPISGRQNVTVTRAGVNLFDLRQFAEMYPEYCTYDESTGELSIVTNSVLFYTGVQVDIPLDVSNGGYFQYEAKNGTGTNFRFRILYEGGIYTEVSGTETQTGYSKFASLLYAKKVVAIRMNWSGTGTFTIKNFCITFGQTTVDYIAPQLQSVTIQLGQTVYGGTLDVTTGVLTVDRANIESYNGETLPGKWISDRDAYSAGATPTIGAQVVYELATPLAIQLTPAQLTTLKGQNNVWSDAGDVTLEYPYYEETEGY